MDLKQLASSPFSEKIGIEVIEATEERAITAITLTREHTNAIGICHGGVIFTLADRAFGLAENMGPGEFVGIEVHVRYLRPAKVGQRLTATARKIHRGKQTAFYRIDVEDEQGRLIACLSGTGHVFEKK